MIPSKIRREKALHNLDTRVRNRVKTCLLIAAMWIFCILPYKLIDNNDTIPYLMFAFIYGLPFVVVLLFTFVIYPLTQMNIKRQEAQFSVYENTISKEELRKEIQRNPKSNGMTISMSGDWIDFEFDIAEMIGPDVGLQSCLIYKKLVLLLNNGTYRELDYYDYRVLQRIDIHSSKGIYIGLLKPRKLRHNVCYTDNKGRLKIKKCYLSALDLTNRTHEWLASRGYKRI